MKGLKTQKAVGGREGRTPLGQTDKNPKSNRKSGRASLRPPPQCYKQRQVSVNTALAHHVGPAQPDPRGESSDRFGRVVLTPRPRVVSCPQKKPAEPLAGLSLSTCEFACCRRQAQSGHRRAAGTPGTSGQRLCLEPRCEHHPEDGFQDGNPLASLPNTRFIYVAFHETNRFLIRFTFLPPTPHLSPSSLPSLACRVLYGTSGSLVPGAEIPAVAKTTGKGGLRDFHSGCSGVRGDRTSNGVTSLAAGSPGREPVARLAWGREDFRHCS